MRLLLASNTSNSIFFRLLLLKIDCETLVVLVKVTASDIAAVAEYV